MSAQFIAPPWVMRMQAEADRAQAVLDARAEASPLPVPESPESPQQCQSGLPRRAGEEQLARDIADSAYEDVIGPRPARHRKEMQS